MVQMFTLRGINIGVRKSLAGIAKVFGGIGERLSHGLPKSLERYAKDFGEVCQRLWGVKHCTMRLHTLYHRASYFVPCGVVQ